MSTRKIVVLTTSPQATAAGVEDGAQVGHDPLGLGLDPALDERSGRRVEGGLAGAEQEAAGDDPLAVRADRGGRPGGRDGSAGHGCAPLLAVADDAPWRRRTASALPGAVELAVAQGRPDGLGRLARPRAPKHRAPTASGRSPTGRSAGRSSRLSARLNGDERRDDERGRRQQVVGRGEDARPGDEIRGGQARPQLLGEVGRRHPDGAVAVRCGSRRTPRRRPASRRRRPASRAATPGAPWSPWSGATCSPRPSTRAGPPARKNGTSEPRLAATAWRARSSSSAPQASSAPSTVAAASDEPPARPAATGMRFSSRAARAGAGPGPPAQPPPTAARAAARARKHEVVGRRAGVEAGDVERVAVRRSIGARLSRSARVSGTNTEWRPW